MGISQTKAAGKGSVLIETEYHFNQTPAFLMIVPRFKVRTSVRHKLHHENGNDVREESMLHQ